jgi:hypothetical protein
MFRRDKQIWPFNYFWSQGVKHVELFFLAVRPPFVLVACSLYTETILQVQSVLLSRDNSVVEKSYSKNNLSNSAGAQVLPLLCISNTGRLVPGCHVLGSVMSKKRTRVMKALSHNNSTALHPNSAMKTRVTKELNAFPLTVYSKQVQN